MIDVALVLLFMVVGYLLGTIPTGYLVARMRGVNIQEVGSGNIGATNVLRTLGVVPALLVMLLDPLKGAVAALLPTAFGTDTWTVALAGLAAVIGNSFNVMLKLRGGKGIATSIGVFLVVDPATAVLSIVLGVLTILVSRYVSLGSIVGMISLPLFVIAGGSFPVANLFLAVALAVLTIYRHRENVMRLMAGTERRLGQKVNQPPEPSPEPAEPPPASRG